ncbi:MAG: PKD domain-containing protein, partial [Crocinitomicaceae bacterium]
SEGRCISVSNSFTPSNAGLATYSWDFGDGNTSSIANPVNDYASADTYAIRLDVVGDNGCTNYVEEEITIYEEPPLPTFTLSSDLACEENEIVFNNTTDDKSYNGGLTYEWEFSGIDSVITQTSPTINFSNPGEKIISLKSKIPGCESEAVTDTLMITALPVTNFSASLSCEGTETTFSNLSDDANYTWYYGDGFQSNEVSPQYLYENAGLYEVKLVAENSLGCINTSTEEIRVASIPTAAFDFDLICANETVQIRDLSSAANADIIAWEWVVGDSVISTESSPMLSFPSAGEVQLEQRVFSSAGCEQSIVKTIRILEPPTPRITYEQRCIGDEFIFAVGDSASEYVEANWLVDGVLTSSGDTLRQVFDQVDTVTIGLTLINNNLCNVTYEEQVIIPEPPDLDFLVDDICQHEFFSVANLSSSNSDPILSQTWYLNDLEIGQGNEVSRMLSDPGEQSITLAVTTVSGCSYELTKDFSVNVAPVVDFSLSADFGVPGSVITLIDQTSFADSAFWVVDLDTLHASGQDTDYQFLEPGFFAVERVALTDAGCESSDAREVIIAEPSIDLSLQSLQLIDNGDGFGSLFAEVINRSNLPIETVSFNISFDNGLSLKEDRSQVLAINQANTYSLETQIPLTNQIKSICVAVDSNYGTQDIQPFDNKECITLEEDKIVFNAPYPNPAVTQLTVPMVLPENSQVQFELLHISGKIAISRSFETEKQGLTTFLLELDNVEAGMYFLRITANEQENTTRILIQ